MMFDRRLLQHFDWILLLMLVIIATISLVNLYSATYPIKDVGGSQIFMKQFYWFLVGLAIMLMMTIFDYHLLERLAYIIYFISLLMLIIVLIIGETRSGSQRWLHFFGINFQPSELAKICIVITLAKYFYEEAGYEEFKLRDLWKPFLLVVIPAVLIVKEPDLGSALILLIVSFSIMLFVRIKTRSLIILVLVFLISMPFAWSYLLKEYQQKRILSFVQPGTDPLGASYHINQSKIAIGSGLLWGKGYKKGTQTRLHFLPEQHTDFVFSVWAEEWGFAGSVSLLLLYLFLILWGINIARNSKDKFGALLALGIIIIVFWQLIINVSMTIGLLPVVGIPLILFSYGGSSIVSTMMGMGLLMNISMRRFMFQ
jgi:rod shape determining protein RodA